MCHKASSASCPTRRPPPSATSPENGNNSIGNPSGPSGQRTPLALFQNDTMTGLRANNQVPRQGGNASALSNMGNMQGMSAGGGNFFSQILGALGSLISGGGQGGGQSGGGGLGGIFQGLMSALGPMLQGIMSFLRG